MATNINLPSITDKNNTESNKKKIFKIKGQESPLDFYHTTKLTHKSNTNDLYGLPSSNNKNQYTTYKDITYQY